MSAKKKGPRESQEFAVWLESHDDEVSYLIGAPVKEVTATHVVLEMPTIPAGPDGVPQQCYQVKSHKGVRLCTTQHGKRLLRKSLKLILQLDHRVGAQLRSHHKELRRVLTGKVPA